MSMATKGYPWVYLKCSFANAEIFKPTRVSTSGALSIKSARNFHSLRSHGDVLRPFSAVRVRTSFGLELSKTRMIVNLSHCGLIGGACPAYFGGIARPFSQSPRVGTQNKIASSDDGGKRGNYSFKTFFKQKKWPKASATHKNETSVEELTSSEGKAMGLKDVNLPSLNGSMDAESYLVTESPQTPKDKEKMKKPSRSKKKQNQSSTEVASVEAADNPNSSAKKIQAKGTRNSRSIQTPTLSEINSGIQTKAMDSSTSTKNVTKKSTRRSAKKEQTNTITKSLNDGELTAQLDGKVSTRQDASLLKKTRSLGQKTWPQLYPPITKSVVVVESVTKAKVIQGYLGEMYEVLPSYGHVRDLAARSGSVRPDDDFSMVWEVPSPAWSHLKSIKFALNGAKNLILASDPDREGEAIAWHIIEMLKQQDALRDDVTVARVVFNEITESSIKSSLQSPRVIDADLVHAYLARRALDYLIGFNVSPLLWRKLPSCQSAGRVQSAALALICDREKEIDEFEAQEYWTIDAQFDRKDNNLAHVSFSSHLTHFDTKKLQQLSISSGMETKDIEEKINLSSFEVVGTKTSKTRRNPPTPFITSTLQQDAANKLNFAASQTMKVAQKLYEGVQLSEGKATGIITYMRTDGLHLSDEAVKDIQSFAGEKYGLNFAAKSARKYFKKVKNAQEAHEAIRPTDIRRLPSSLVGVLDEDSLKLYTLIWSRTMACQMEPAIIEQIQCDIGNVNKSIMFRSTCSRVEFLGFQAVYEDVETARIKNNEDDEEGRHEVFEVLSNLRSGNPLSLIKLESEQHHTQPPPRYTEGSLVKKLEELGIGRPSTYATTIKVLKDRYYITTRSRTLYPEFRGRMVSAFLSHYFSEVTDYSFTADMETELDNVSAGMTEWKGLLKDYWTRFSKYCESASNVHVHQVEKMLEKTYGYFLFSSLPDRTCPSCLEGTLNFKVSKFGDGYFIGCDQHPRCKYIAKTLYGDEEEEVDPEQRRNNTYEPKLLGLNPGTNEKVLLKCGPYGHYVQLGEDRRKGYLPKRASVHRRTDVESLTLEDALYLLKYPVTLGNHPNDGRPVILSITKEGFGIKHRRSGVPLPKNVGPDEITLEKALELLGGDNVKQCGRPKAKGLKKKPIDLV